RPAGIVRDERARADLISYCRLIDLLSLVRVTEDLLGPVAGRPLHITLPDAQPVDWAESTTPCPIVFGAESATVTYPSHVADAKPLRANPIIFRAQCNVAHQMSLMLADDVPLSEQVRRWLWAYSPPLDRSGVAANLKLSERTLSRRLKSEGTSFQTLLSEVQYQRASALLARTRLSVAEIGYKLGYAEPAAFTHAFSAWSGTTPSEWRAVHQMD
ncbi:MAG: helix-turn-helix transcriptional regulator, partial [Pseudomonadota bacterium]